MSFLFGRINLVLRAGKILLVGLLACSVSTCQNKKPSVSDLNGTIVGENVYTNQALRMTMELPGAWEFVPQSKQETAQSSGQSGKATQCQGLFCHGADINISLREKGSIGPTSGIFLRGYKLSQPFLDRTRFPLIRIAKGMAEDGVKGTPWFLSGDPVAVQLGEKPAFRLLVHEPLTDGYEAKGFGYVAESNGYVFLMIGTSVPEFPQKLQTAMENVKFAVPDKASR
jgi:hypothetical protein